jgi:hypothetical protein
MAALLMLACPEKLLLTSKDRDGGLSIRGPGYRFRGPDAAQQAAIDALLYIHPSTERDGVERGGMICRDPDGAAFATEPVVGTSTGVDPTRSPCSKGTKTHGDYHTHPVGPLKKQRAPFSKSDTDNCEYEACWVAQMLEPGQQLNIWSWLPGLNSQFHVYP